jgi:D-Tyr-tRNAtyr deacylase
MLERERAKSGVPLNLVAADRAALEKEREVAESATVVSKIRILKDEDDKMNQALHHRERVVQYQRVTELFDSSFRPRIDPALH